MKKLAIAFTLVRCRSQHCSPCHFGQGVSLTTFGSEDRKKPRFLPQKSRFQNTEIHRNTWKNKGTCVATQAECWDRLKEKKNPESKRYTYVRDIRARYIYTVTLKRGSGIAGLETLWHRESCNSSRHCIGCGRFTLSNSPLDRTLKRRCNDFTYS
jgi:hypothetical protein